MIKYLLFFFVLIFNANAYSGEHFFYYHGTKIMMIADESTICVKFASATSAYSMDRIIQNSIGEKLDKMSSFSPGSSRSSYIILKLKSGISLSDISSIKSSLLNIGEIDYVGNCFPHGRKVKHYTTNEILVKFRNNIAESRINIISGYYKLKIIEKAQGFNNVYLVAVDSKGQDGSDDVFDIANKLTLLSDAVEFAQPNFIREGMLLSEDNSPPPLPNDSLVSQMWHIKNTGNNIPENVVGIPGSDMNMDSAWAITTGDPKVIISIIDTGTDTNHVDLKNNLSSHDLWYNAIDNNGWPYDELFHGTGVSGCSSAIGNNRWGTVGVAYGCKFMPVKVFGTTPYAYTTDYILSKGINWAWQHGASVLNLSWGGGVPSPLITESLQNAMNFGRSGRGCVVFAGAGNDNVDTLLYPARLEGVLGIGGLSPCNQRKSLVSCDNVSQNQNWGASYGPGLSVVAPCTFIGTTELTYPFGNIPYWCICGNGTSTSSPLAAGVGALIISKNGYISADSVRIIIERSAKKVGNYSYNVQMPNGLWNYEMGYGRIDGKAALDMTPAGPQIGTDVTIPKIEIYPPESQAFSSRIIINASITDVSGIAGGINSPRLYYYTDQNSSLQYITGVSNGSGSYSFTVPRIPYSMGFHYYVSAQDNSANGCTYPLGGKSSNPPGSQRPQRMLYLRNAPTTDSSFISANVPIDFNTAVRETTFVSLLHNPVIKTVLDVDCWFNINHNYDADLTMTLISPTGTEVILSGGLGDSLTNYINTYFDDEAPMRIDSSAVHAPFTGHFKPLGRLWFFDGENSSGDWKLKVIDNGRGDVGTLLSWGMNIRYASIGDYIMVPGKFSLVGNYPNPFNPKTRILFNVPYASNIKIVLYDLTGRQVKTLMDERRGPALEDFVDFDISSVSGIYGSGIASGVYFYTLAADGKFIESKKMVVLK